MKMIARICFLAAALSGSAAVAQSTPPTSTQSTPQNAAPAALPDAPDAPGAPAAQAVAIVSTGPTAVIDTTMGRLTCRLFSTQSPLAVANFIGLSEGTRDWTDPVTKQKVSGKPFYAGTTFHRVIPGFMIQGGDRAGDGSGDAGYYFDNENTPGLLFDQPGRLAMANAGPNTNGTQFFITEQAVPQLNGGYTIFGQCDEHSALLAATIARVPRNGNDKPNDPVTITKVTIVREGQNLPPMPPTPGGMTPPDQPPVHAPQQPAPQQPAPQQPAPQQVGSQQPAAR